MKAALAPLSPAPISRSGRGRRKFALLALAVIVASTCYTLNYLYLKQIVLRANPSVDFSCFYRAGQMLVSGDGAAIYQVKAQQQYDRQLGNVIAPGKWLEFRPFSYPPFVLLVFGPLALLPYHLAESLWFLANVGMLLAMPFVLRDLLGRGNLAAFVIILTAFFMPVEFALIQGQNSIVVVLCLATVLAQLTKGHEGLAGFFLALAMWKPQLALPMLLALILAKKWKVVVGFLSTSVILFGASVALLGWHTTVSSPMAISQFTHLRTGFGGDYAPYMANVRGILYVLLHPRMSDSHLQALVILVSAMLVLLATYIFRKYADQPYELRYAFVIVITALTSHHYYLHDMSLLLLAFLICIAHASRHALSINRLILLVTIAAFFVIPFGSRSYQDTIVCLFAATGVLAATLLVEIASLKQESCASEPSYASRIARRAAAQEVGVFVLLDA